jgi:trehalose/maltose transport system substrate-binding protein
VGRELDLCRTAADAWSRQTGHRVRIVSAPGASNERLALYQQLLAAGSPDLDVLQVDVIWPGILARELADLTPYAGDAPARHFPALIANNTVAGRLVALPWFSSVGLLYYRRDLLQRHGEAVPRTWEQLTATARRVQAAERAAGADRFWGYVWQGRAYEGLTCNALEWLAADGGGTLVDPAGQVTVDNPAAAAAVTRAAGWVGDISPPGTLNYAEEEARGVFQSGHALFMRNWPYAWALAQTPDSPVRDRVGVAALPAATLGGWQLAVSRHSRHPELAARLVLYLTSAPVQKQRAIAASLYPTRPALYQDPEIRAANPFLGTLETSLTQALARPSARAGSAYNRLSSRTWNAVHRVLAGRQPAPQALSRLARELRRILRRGRP